MYDQSDMLLHVKVATPKDELRTTLNFRDKESKVQNVLLLALS